MTKLAVALLAAASLFAGSAVAQSQDNNITLQVDTGSVMTSTGGDYASANSGQMLVVGEKVMVNAGSSAVAIFKNGCRVEFRQPGVYTVPAECRAAGWTNGSHASGSNALIIAGTAVAIGAVIGGQNNTPNGPLSAGIRHF